MDFFDVSISRLRQDVEWTVSHNFPYITGVPEIWKKNTLNCTFLYRLVLVLFLSYPLIWNEIKWLLGAEIKWQNKIRVKKNRFIYWLSIWEHELKLTQN